MYHCYIHFYLMGKHDKIFEIIKKSSPQKRFVHEFYESEEVEIEKISQSQVIIANLSYNTNANDLLQTILSTKKKENKLLS